MVNQEAIYPAIREAYALENTDEEVCMNLHELAAWGQIFTL